MSLKAIINSLSGVANYPPCPNLTPSRRSDYILYHWIIPTDPRVIASLKAIINSLSSASQEWPMIVIATAPSSKAVAADLQACFLHHVEMKVSNRTKFEEKKISSIKLQKKILYSWFLPDTYCDGPFVFVKAGSVCDICCATNLKHIWSCWIHMHIYILIPCMFLPISSERMQAGSHSWLQIKSLTCLQTYMLQQKCFSSFSYWPLYKFCFFIRAQQKRREENYWVHCVRDYLSLLMLTSITLPKEQQ